VRWETEQSFDGKLCREYLYQKLSKCVIDFQVTVKSVGDAFLRHSVVVQVFTLCSMIP